MVYNAGVCLEALLVPTPTHLAVLELPSPDAATRIKGDHELGSIRGAGAFPEGASKAQAVSDRCWGRQNNPDRGEQEASHELSPIKDGAAS